MSDWTQHIRTLEGARQAAMTFLAQTLPESDLDSYPAALMQEAVDHALDLRERAPWCAALEEELFLHYVLCPRVNDEDLSSHRALFYQSLWPRVEGLPLEQVVLEVNRWCHEQASYQCQDDRTASPLTVFRSGSGRCGEESTFLVAALRSVGVAARQVYAPRWSHCDDNHAWVEALCGTTWRFLGACEPEPILNRGWFNTSASRAVLVHSRTFGQGTAPLHGEVLGTEGGVTYYNQTARYAKTVPYTFKATRAGAPAAGAVFRLQVLNESTFYTIATLTANEAGEARARLGAGSLYVSASQAGLCAEGFCQNNRINLALLPPAGEESAWTEFDFLAPKDQLVNPAVLSPKQKSARATTLAHGDALRLARLSKQLDEKQAAKLPGAEDLLRNARGNEKEIRAFLSKQGALGEQLVRTLSRKDLRDVEEATLTEHLLGAAPYAETIPEDLFVPYVLCPRVEWEKLTPWRTALTQLIPPHRKEVYRQDPRTLWWDLGARIRPVGGRVYTNLYWTPDCAFQMGRCDARSLRVLYVALLRSIGVPARLRVTDGVPEFWKEGAFHPAVPQERGTISFTKTEAQTPIYRQNWSLSRREGTQWKRLTLSDEVWQGTVYRLELPAGTYRLITSVRLPNGNQFSAMRGFTLRAGEEKSLPLRLREFVLEDLLGCQDMPQIPAETLAGDSLADAVRMEGRPSLLFWLEEGNEPTEHVLNELTAGWAALERLPVNVTFLLRSRESLKQPTLAALLAAWPAVQVLFDDWAFDLETVARHLTCDPDRPPLAVACNGAGQAVYGVSGYHVGSVELLTRIAAKLVEKQ